jgi:hypothetical protein
VTAELAEDVTLEDAVELEAEELPLELTAEVELDDVVDVDELALQLAMTTVNCHVQDPFVHAGFE